MKISPAVLAPLVTVVYRLWSLTLRYEQIDRDRVEELDDAGTKLVFCLWHDELFSALRVARKLRLAAVVSRSSDGELLARVMQKLGMMTARGSSSRGGAAALHQTIGLMQQHNRNGCVTMDGPRGPRHKIKDGAVFLAHHGKALLVPVRIFNQKAKRFNSWDKFQLPLPFSRVRICFGEPYAPECGDLDKEIIEQAKAVLAEKMDLLEKQYGFQR